MTRNILYINHKGKQCGVYQFGKTTADVISRSEKYDFIYCECNSIDELKKEISVYKPVCIIFNYHPSTQSWITPKLKYSINIPIIGTIHEVSQQIADNTDNQLFDYYIAADPTLLLRNPIVYKVGRLVSRDDKLKEQPEHAEPVIGSFGFATKGKGFEKLIKQVEYEFDRATIRINIPFAEFGDKDGSKAKEMAEILHSSITNKEIKLQITHDFWTIPDLRNFLNSNSVNAFFYEEGENRGIASVIDFALSVDRPIIITDSSMFRHIKGAIPGICINNTTIKKVIENGTEPLKNFKQEWNAENLVWEYERIANSVLGNPFPKRGSYLFDKIKRKIKGKEKKFTWLRDDESIQNKEHSQSNDLVFNSVVETKLNRILDDSARHLYTPVIEQMNKAMPLTMRKKIPEANVQQAFSLNTVYNNLGSKTNTKVLCVGSYESTDAIFLTQLGMTVEEIDPMLNYSLEEFFCKPSTKKSSYDIIFSTSVIEHVKEDEQFITQICELLKEGGTAILTCDFKEGYKKGDPKPGVDHRFYTQDDFNNRFLPILSAHDCVLADRPDWDCPAPDFYYQEAGTTFNYTFATFVFKKNTTSR